MAAGLHWLHPVIKTPVFHGTRNIMEITSKQNRVQTTGKVCVSGSTRLKVGNATKSVLNVTRSERALNMTTAEQKLPLFHYKEIQQ